MNFKKIDGKIKGDFSKLKDGNYTAKPIELWRTKLQNDLYWGWYIPYIKAGFEEKGEFITEEEIHEGLKEKLLSYRKLNKLTGTYKKYVGSTANLKRKGFMKFLKDIEQYIFRDFEIIIPDYNNY